MVTDDYGICLIQCDRDELVSLHLPMVKLLLILAVKPPREIDGLVQIGLIGLLKAKEDYQADSGAAFSTYATIRIRGAMMDELRARDWLPRSVQKNLSRVATALQKAEQQLGRAPTDTEVARTLGVSLGEYHELLADVSLARLTPVEDVEAVLVMGARSGGRESFELLR